MHYLDSIIDFGSFHWEEKKDTTVTPVNKGKKPLVIHDIATSCGCTVADYDKRPAMPGKCGYLKKSSLFLYRRPLEKLIPKTMTPSTYTKLFQYAKPTRRK